MRCHFKEQYTKFLKDMKESKFFLKHKTLNAECITRKHQRETMKPLKPWLIQSHS